MLGCTRTRTFPPSVPLQGPVPASKNSLARLKCGIGSPTHIKSARPSQAAAAQSEARAVVAALESIGVELDRVPAVHGSPRWPPTQEHEGRQERRRRR